MNFRKYLVAFLSFGPLLHAAFAHPGHDLLAHGPAHVATSAYHLWVLGLTALVSFGVAQIVRKPVARRALRIAGVTALLAAGVGWGFGM